jgi:hypothetical protein
VLSARGHAAEKQFALHAAVARSSAMFPLWPPPARWVALSDECGAMALALGSTACGIWMFGMRPAPFVHLTCPGTVRRARPTGDRRIKMTTDATELDANEGTRPYGAASNRLTGQAPGHRHTPYVALSSCSSWQKLWRTIRRTRRVMMYTLASPTQSDTRRWQSGDACRTAQPRHAFARNC